MSAAPVGVLVFGVSTPFSYFLFDLVQNCVEAISGASLRLHIATLHELRDGFSRRGGGSVVVTGDFPDFELSGFVARSNLPLIAVADRIEDMFDWTVKSRAIGGRDAAKLCVRVISALAPFLTAPRALRLSGADDKTPERLVAEIVAHLYPGRGEALAAQVFERLVETGKLARDRTVERDYLIPVTERTPEQVEASALVAAYADFLAGRWPKEIVWPLEWFSRPDGAVDRSPVDLTGPARVLFYGPYLHLPVGEWLARVEFEIDGVTSGVEAATDVVVNEVVTEKTFAMPASGIYAYELSFRVTDPHVAVEIRLFTKKGAIEGKFLARSVRIRPKAAVSTPP